MRVKIIDIVEGYKPKLKKACAYTRVSTGSISQGLSLENQEEYFERIIKTNPEYEFVGVFSDGGSTGTKADRPEFQRMLDLAYSGGVDIILTKSISRFARNTVDLLEIVRKLKEINVEVKFQEENINTLSGDGELMLTVLSSFSQEESKSVSDNIKWMFKKKFEKGEFVINSNRFMGYDKDEFGDLIINPIQAKTVERIFKEYLGGKGAYKIAKMLNEENIPTVTGAKWSEATLLDMLKNEKYKGDLILQKTYTKDHLSKKKCKNKGDVESFYVEDNHSPIILKEDWNAVQIEIERRAKGNNKSTPNIVYPLSGMLYCSKCGAVLIRRIWNSNKNYSKVVWQCSTYIRHGIAHCCGTKIEDSIISNVNIDGKTIVEEKNKNGKKYYSYTNKSK